MCWCCCHYVQSKRQVVSLHNGIVWSDQSEALDVALTMIDPAEQGAALRLPEGCKVLGLDMDDTITAWPKEFAAMSQQAKQHGIRVVIITSRSEQGRRETVTELKAFGIHYDALHFLPPMSWANEHCPHKQLNWYQRWLWFKIKIAKDEGVTFLFDDDRNTLQALAVRT